MISKSSYAIKGLDWTEADHDMKKKVAAHPMAGRGLGLICSAPVCEIIDPLLLFTHPDSGHEIYLCKGHWRLANYEMKELERKHNTLGAFLKEVAADNGGNLKFASIGKTTGLFGGTDISVALVDASSGWEIGLEAMGNPSRKLIDPCIQELNWNYAAYYIGSFADDLPKLLLNPRG